MTNVTTVSTVSHEGGRAISLHELNNRLERYISQIQLDPDTPNISIAVDRVSEGGSFSMDGTPEYDEYERMVSRTLIIICRVKLKADCSSYKSTQSKRRRLQGWRVKFRF